MATNERTNVKLFPTAIASDVLFFVQVSSNLPKNKGVAYGAPYRTCLPNAVEVFPDHQLVYITPADEQGATPLVVEGVHPVPAPPGQPILYDVTFVDAPLATIRATADQRWARA
mgnify:CR=1 FL=1